MSIYGANAYRTGDSWRAFRWESLQTALRDAVGLILGLGGRPGLVWVSDLSQRLKGWGQDDPGYVVRTTPARAWGIPGQF